MKNGRIKRLMVKTLRPKETNIQIEAKVWAECRKYADRLWQSLRDKNLLSVKHATPNVPEVLIAVIHSNVMWNVPEGWNLEVETGTKKKKK